VYKILKRPAYQNIFAICKRNRLVKSKGYKTAYDYRLANIERSITIVSEVSRQRKSLRKVQLVV
jgi:hypothetical protein